MIKFPRAILGYRRDVWRVHVERYVVYPRRVSSQLEGFGHLFEVAILRENDLHHFDVWRKAGGDDESPARRYFGGMGTHEVGVKSV